MSHAAAGVTDVAVAAVAPAGTAGVPAPVPGLAIPGVGQGGAVGGIVPDRRMVIVTLPTTSRPLAAVPALDRAGTDATVAEAGLADASDTASPAALDAAVVAAHEARIALLRRSAEALRAGGAPQATLAGLHERLRRAEAARDVALARAADDRVDCPGGSEARPCRAPAVVIAREGGAAGGAPTTVRRRRPPTAVPPIAVKATASVRLLGYRAGGQGRWLGVHGAAVIASTGITGGFGARHRLLHARRSLAAARRLLDDRAGSRAGSHGAVYLASLWRWDGSDRWTLAPDRPYPSVPDRRGGAT